MYGACCFQPYVHGACCFPVVHVPIAHCPGDASAADTGTATDTATAIATATGVTAAANAAAAAAAAAGPAASPAASAVAPPQHARTGETTEVINVDGAELPDDDERYYTVKFGSSGARAVPGSQLSSAPSATASPPSSAPATTTMTTLSPSEAAARVRASQLTQMLMPSPRPPRASWTTFSLYVARNQQLQFLTF